MTAPGPLRLLRVTAVGAALCLVGVVGVNYLGVGFYPDLQDPLPVLRPVQYLITGAVVIIAMLLMAASVLIVVIGFSLWVFDLTTRAVKALVAGLRSESALDLAHMTLGTLALVGLIAPLVAVVWLTGGWGALEFWVSALFVLAVLGLLASFPASLVSAIAEPMLRRWHQWRGRQVSPYDDPPGLVAVSAAAWLSLLVWLYLAWGGSMLFPYSRVRLPHPDLALGSLLAGAAALLAVGLVGLVIGALDRAWSAFYKRQKLSHRRPMAAPASIPAPVPQAATPPADDLEEMWSPEPVMGWRAWRWDEAILFGARQAWPKRELVAECQTCNQAPGLHCTCGIYAVKVPADLDGFGHVSFGDTVVGRVELSGLVIEHEKGYRAQRARIVDLWAPDTVIGQALTKRYGCTVRVDNPEFWRKAGLYG